MSQPNRLTRRDLIRGAGDFRVIGMGDIKAALEFARRLNLSAAEDRARVRSPSDLAVILLPEMAHLEREHFVVVSLDTRNNVLAKKTLYIGSLNATQ